MTAPAPDTARDTAQDAARSAAQAAAASRISALVDGLCARRWGELDPERRRWAHAIGTVALALRPNVRLHNLLDAAPFDAADLDLVDTLDTAANLGFFPRRSTAAAADIDARLLPCICRPRDNADSLWIVHGRAAGNSLVVYDCAQQRIETIPGDDPRLRRKADVWMFKRFDPNAQSISRFVREGSGHSWFRALCGRFSGVFKQILIAGLFLNLVALSIPLFIMLVYDNVIFSGASELLPGLAVGAGLAIAMEFALRAVRAHGVSWLAARLDNIVSNKIFAQLLELPPADVERASVPAQIARIKTFEAVRDFFCSGAFLYFLELPFVLLSLTMIAVIAGPLVLAPLIFIAAFLVLFHIVRQRVKVAIRIAAKASSARQKFALETLEKLEAIRIAGLADLWADKYRQLSGREGLAHFRLNQIGQVGEIGARGLSVIAGVATVSLGAVMFWNGQITTGALVAAMILVWRCLAPLSSLCAIVPRIEQLRNSILQINTLMDLETEFESQARASFPAIKGGLAFRNVTLRYAETDDPALEGVSFEARPGDFIAVTGGSGSGKSSLLKLVKGMHRPESGAVLIDGFDVRQLDTNELRRQIAYAPQIPAFFAGTVLDNLLLGHPRATEADARAALERIGALKDIEALPKGLHSKIAAHGPAAPAPSLSAKLSLARALMQDAKLVLIDELPNALMCGPAGAAIKAYLEEVRGEKTVVFVTPRDDFLRCADVVVALSRYAPARVYAPGSQPVAPQLADGRAAA
ncbi:MAG: ATP-binding cassette domain-containing protein [Maricaulaceae bacterium]|jgi:ABC-type bacteriocin/lantibiotic exporter with double-glycine peptidase domain